MATINDIKVPNPDHQPLLESDNADPSSDEEDKFSDAKWNDEDVSSSDIELVYDSNDDDDIIDYVSEDMYDFSDEKSKSSPKAPPPSHSSSFANQSSWLRIGHIALIELAQIVWIFIKFSFITTVVFVAALVLLYYAENEYLEKAIEKDTDTCPAV